VDKLCFGPTYSPIFFLLGYDVFFTTLSIQNSSGNGFVVSIEPLSNSLALDKGTLDLMQYQLEYSFLGKTRFSSFSLKGASKSFKKPILSSDEREQVIKFNQIFTGEFCFEVPGRCIIY